MSELDLSSSHEGRLALLEKQDNSINKAIERFDAKLDTVIHQLSKIAVLEVNHGHHSDGLGRAFKQIHELEVNFEGRISGLEKFMNRTSGMAQLAYILWGAMGGGLFLLAIKVMFFMGAKGVVA